MRHLTLLLIVMVAASAVAEVAPAERYTVIHQRSIFSRRRTPAPVAAPAQAEATTEPDAPTAPAEPVDPASLLRLVGVSLVGETRVAFFEDAQDGTVKPVSADDALADRRIVRVDLDSIVVTKGEDPQEQTITIGQALSGAQLEAPPPIPAAAPASADDAALSVIERLRRQREQELNP